MNNPYFIVERGLDAETSYNKYPEFQAWEEGRQAGIEEVVEWIKSHSQLEQCDSDTMAYFTDYYAIERAEWQSKLREWNLI